MHEKQSATFLVPAEDYQQIIKQLDKTRLQETFVGRFDSREAFGLHLLADTNAEAQLATLPTWLRGCVRLDGEALAAELEASGLYVIAPVSSGVCVFDGAAARPAERSQL